MSETKGRKIAVKSVFIVVGIICIVLIAGLVGAVAYVEMRAINSLNTKNINLQNQNSQLQAYLDENKTLLNQTQTWLNGNVTYYASQISALQDLENQLENWLSGNITYYDARIESLNSEIVMLNSTISQFTSFPNVGLHMTYEQFFEWIGHNETTLMTWNVTGLQDGLANLQVSSYNVDVNASDNSAIISVADDNWTVDLSNREIVNSTHSPQIIGFECPFWIEKNVTIGSVINTLYGQATITGSRTLNVLGQQRDCWIVAYEWPTSSMVRWYDKATGIVLLIQVVRQEQGISILSNETATETNIFQLSQGH